MKKKKNNLKKVKNTSGFNGGIGIGGGINPIGFPGNQGSPWTAQVENVDTSFANLRWYLVSNDRQFLNQLYCEIGLVQTIVDVPVDDALRGGIEIKSEQLSEDQIADLQVAVDRDDDLNTAGQAGKWNRQFGGAGILILTDQDPTEPININAINPNTPLQFRAVDMWELFWDQQNMEGYDPTLQTADFEFYSYYGNKIHKSRVMRLIGLTPPSFIRPKLRGWGLSVIETLIRPLNQFFKASDVIFEVTDEFKVDVYKVKNLVNTLLSPDGDSAIRGRIQRANWLKNYLNAIVMDSEDDYIQKQITFSGLAEMSAENRMQLAAAMRMPLSKLFGISATGFSSGEDDLEVYNSMVESQVRNKLKYPILKMLEIKCQQMFGFIPDDMSIAFKPLRMMTAEQEENVKTQKFTRLVQAKQIGEISSEHFADACNKGDLFDVTLEAMDMGLEPMGSDEENVAGDEGEKEKGDAPDAANTPTSETPKAPIGEIPKVKDIQKPKEGETVENSFFTWNGKKYERHSHIESILMNDVSKNIKRYTWNQRIDRILSNSAEFDKASYEADGGDAMFDTRRELFFENPGNVDESLWDKAKKASMASYGKIKWQFVTFMYKKMGGKFN